MVDASSVVFWAVLASIVGCSDDTAPIDAGRDCELGVAAGECASDADCTTGICRRDPSIAPVDLESAPLACGAAVGSARIGAPCTLASDCAHGLCAVSGRCVGPCGEATCAEDELCTHVFVRHEAAIERVRACVPDVVVPAAVERVRTLMRGPEIRLEGLGTSGIAVVTGPCDLPAIEPLSLRTTTSIAIFDAGTRSTNPIGGAPLTIFVPNNALTPIDPSGYLLAVTGVGHELDVLELARPGTGGTIDLELYYAGPFSIEGDRGPPAVAAAIDGLERRYAGAGVEIGTVRQHDLVGGLLDRLAIVEGDARDEELELLAMLSAGEDRPALRLAFVRSMEGLVGFTAAIPGPPGTPGRAGGTIAIGAELLSASTLDRAVSHEVGHFLGLFHPTELDGSSVEPIADTPECDPSFDVDGDRILSDAECAGQGAENLMFWTATGDTLSADQLEVVGRSVLLE